jgi:hypothetical protein
MDSVHCIEPFLEPPSNRYKPWPIGARELTALVELGLSDDRIATYFGVNREKVSALRRNHGLERIASQPALT